MLPANSLVSASDLMRLNEALRKSAGTVGYQTAAVPDPNAPLSPLVPQSIEGMLSIATHSMAELKLWPMIPKKDVASTLHEYVVVNEHGLDLDPFIGEGGGSSADMATGFADYTRKSIRIKFMAERRTVSDVASLVGLIGDNRNAIAEETERGTLALMRKVESALWHGDESMNPEGFDGIIKQLKDAGSSHDLSGSAPTPLLLQEVLGEIYSAPNFGRPDTIYVEPRVHAELIRQTVESGRHDQLSVRDSSQMTFGAQNIFITAPYGQVKVEAAPFLFTAHAAPAAAVGESPVVGSAPSAAVAADAAALLPAGDYFYKVVAVGKKGASAPFLGGSAQTVGAGDKVTITLPASSGVLYWKIYRSEKNGAASTCKLIDRVAGQVAGVATLASYVDLGQHKLNTSNIVFAQHTPDAMEFMRLLDFMRRPLAETSTAQQFLLMLFGSPVVKLPKKMFVLEQAGVNQTAGLDANYLSPNR